MASSSSTSPPDSPPTTWWRAAAVSPPQGGVAPARRITGERSVGHLGTLDPMATGVLPLLLGKFTRLAQYFSASEKSYSGSIRFGFATDTYDAEGDRVGEQTEPVLTLEQIRAAASRFHGEMDQ